MRVTFVCCGLEHLGIEALSAYVRAHGHETALVYEPRPFSSGSGTDIPLLARWLEPSTEQTVAVVLATRPDVVAFTSYSVTHRWSVYVAHAIKRGLPGEGPRDQMDALRFYSAARPKRIVTHWMTYFPGTTALEHARRAEWLTDAEIERILDGDVGPGYMFDANAGYADRDELRRLSGVFDLLPLLPHEAVKWLLEDGRYRYLPKTGVMRQLGALVLALRGEPATREHVRQIFATTVAATRQALRRKLSPPAATT